MLTAGYKQTAGRNKRKKKNEMQEEQRRDERNRKSKENSGVYKKAQLTQRERATAVHV